MGKVIPCKENIYAVWESSKDAVDTVVQGLFGRLCGYTKVNPDIKIYACLSQIKTYLTVMEEDFEMTSEVYQSLGDGKKLSRGIKNIKGKELLRSRVISTEEFAKLDRNATAYHWISKNTVPEHRARYQAVADGKFSQHGLYKTKGKKQLCVITDPKDGPVRYALCEAVEYSRLEYSRLEDIVIAKSHNCMYNSVVTGKRSNVQNSSDAN